MSLAGDLRDLARREGLNFGDLGGRCRPHGQEAGFAQEALLLLKVGGAGWEKKKRKNEDRETWEELQEAFHYRVGFRYGD